MHDILGKRFNKLTVVSRAPRRGPKEGRRWWCRCVCGQLKDVLQQPLTNGMTGTCGSKGCKSTMVPKHGMYLTVEYRTWNGMKQRCSNPQATNYARYGGRGITVCKRWLIFSNFYADMGPRPTPAHTLDRIDGERGYSPGNVRWATPAEQQGNIKSNVRITYKGRTQHLSAWAREFGLPSVTLSHRLLLGIPFAKAIQKPREITRQWAYLHRGQWKGLDEWAREANIRKATLYSRLRKGMTMQQAMQPTSGKGGRLKRYRKLAR